MFAVCSPSYLRKWSPSRQNRALYNRRQREHNSYACRIDFLEIRQPIPIFAMKALPVPFLRLLRSIAATLALLWVISVFAASQDSSPKATPGQTTAVVNVNEVSLNMVVRDRKGKLVSDLKPEDIAVTDGNSPVKISTLRLVTGDRGEHLLTMVFDRMDSSAGHNARDIAGKILKMMPPDGFSFCVVKAESRLMLYQNFTEDRSQLAEAIHQATDEELARAGRPWEGAEKRASMIAQTGSDESGTRLTATERVRDQAVFASLQESQRILLELHTQPGLAGLLALSRNEQRLPGRKTVLYFTQGLQSDAASEDRLHEIVGAANRSEVSMYVIDTNPSTAQADQNMVAMMAAGNVRSAMAQAGPAATVGAGASGPQSLPQQVPGLAPMVNDQLNRYENNDQDSNKSPLSRVAANTGGSYVASGEDFKKSIHRMIEDMTMYYEASYASPIENYDGQFRAIAVKPVRPGLRISSRAGYFALPPGAGQAARPFETALLKTLEQPGLSTDISFQTKVLRLGTLPGEDEEALVVEIPVSALETKNDPNTNLYSLHVSLAARIKNKAGAIVEQFGEDIPRHGSLSEKDAQTGTVTMQRHFTAEPGDYVLEAVVQDQNSGKMGAQRTEFTIPSEPGGASLSDLTMVQRIDSVPADADPLEPLRYGKGKVIPSVSETVSPGTKELSFFFVVHSVGSSTDPARLEMEVLKSGESIASVPLPLRRSTGPSAIPYVASIQTAKLSSGEYRIVERLTDGGKTVERELAFRIAGNGQETEDARAAATTSAKDENEDVTASGLQLPETAGPSGHGVVITSLPAGTVPPPSSDDVQKMIEEARKRALDYSKTLPNFLCIEVTNRSVDPAGKGSWKHRDSLAELLSYHDNSETRTTLEVNGRRSSLKRADLNSSWPLSVGEFGAMLNLVFQPGSKTTFEWKEAASLGSGTVQVLSYRVDRDNATIVLSEGSDEAAVGFHGLLYLDPSTGGVRRVTLQADGIPRSFAVRAAAMTVDYDYVAISGRDYLLPVRSSVSLEKAHRKIELNEITFRNYRRFASRTKIKMMQ
jgi:VWFA-related protein